MVIQVDGGLMVTISVELAKEIAAGREEAMQQLRVFVETGLEMLKVEVTREVKDPLSDRPSCVYPMPLLPDRGIGYAEPRITSRFRTKNKQRPMHDGIDLFYRRQELLDKEIGVGKGMGTAKWVIPVGTPAIAVKAGYVQKAGKIRTGFRCWVDHNDDDERSGYFHLSELWVDEGDKVEAGSLLGLVGAGPKSAKHLHFEISAAEAYIPEDPEDWLKRNGAVMVTLP